jgi:hypothetical protein
MKKTIFICLLAIIALSSRQTLKAQITLEHIYTNTSNATLGPQEFIPVYIGPSGFKYAIIDTNQIRLYNLNHSLFRQFPIPISAHGYSYNVFLITENLFDTDSTNIEYLVDKGAYSGVSVYREDTSLVFNEDSVGFLQNGFTSTVPVTPLWIPIVSTDSGVKMILIKPGDTSIKVYSLPGVLPSCCCGNSFITGIQNPNGNFNNSMSAFPNPSNGNTTIEFNLPQGANKGEIVIYNMQGVELKRYTVDNTFHTLLLNNSEFHAGTYFYQLLTTNGGTSAKKMIVIH